MYTGIYIYKLNIKRNNRKDRIELIELSSIYSIECLIKVNNQTDNKVKYLNIYL